MGTVQELKRWLYEEAPDTGASRGFWVPYGGNL
jgi:hypothetical protein